MPHYDVDYRCGACGITWTLQQGSPEPDEDLDLCPDCLDVVLFSVLHGTREDPWTYDKILDARGL